MIKCCYRPLVILDRPHWWHRFTKLFTIYWFMVLMLVIYFAKILNARLLLILHVIVLWGDKSEMECIFIGFDFKSSRRPTTTDLDWPQLTGQAVSNANNTRSRHAKITARCCTICSIYDNVPRDISTARSFILKCAGHSTSFDVPIFYIGAAVQRCTSLWAADRLERRYHVTRHVTHCCQNGHIERTIVSMIEDYYGSHPSI